MTDNTAASPQDKNTAGQDASPERLGRLLAQLNKYEEGRNVTAYAAENHIAIRFADPQNAQDTNFIEGSNARYDPKTKTVMLNPLVSDDTLLSDLPHEVWHGSQDQRGITKAEGKLRNPTQRIGLHNITEAAAYTEQAVDGIPLPKDEMRQTKDSETLADLRAIYDKALKNHETPEAARLEVFKAALKYESKSKIDDTEFVALVQINAAMELVKTFKPEEKRIVVGQEGAELSQQELADLMRKAGNMTLGPSGGNFLSSMKDTDIVELSTSQISPRNAAELRETQNAYDDVRRQVAPKSR